MFTPGKLMKEDHKKFKIPDDLQKREERDSETSLMKQKILPAKKPNRQNNTPNKQLNRQNKKDQQFQDPNHL